MAIKIITDSASDISQIEAEQLKIKVLPLEVRFNEDVYLDGVSLLPEDFYKKLLESVDLPKTSQINPARWDEAFKEATADGSEALVICLSSKLSGTYRSAHLAAQEYDGKVIVIDSLQATVGQKILVLEALRLANEGNLTLAELAKEVEKLKKHVRIVAMIDTLKFLKKGGRISAIAAIGGELLSIKPVVGIVDGEVKVLGKARGSKNANNLLNKTVTDHSIDFSKPAIAVYAGFSTVAIEKYIEDSKHLYVDHLEKLPITQMGATIGTHIGPGGMGVAYFSIDADK